MLVNKITCFLIVNETHYYLYSKIEAKVSNRLA